MNLYVVQYSILKSYDDSNDIIKSGVIPIAFDAFENAVDYMADYDISEVSTLLEDDPIRDDTLLEDHWSRVAYTKCFTIELWIQELALQRTEDD